MLFRGERSIPVHTLVEHHESSWWSGGEQAEGQHGASACRQVWKGNWDSSTDKWSYPQGPLVGTHSQTAGWDTGTETFICVYWTEDGERAGGKQSITKPQTILCLPFTSSQRPPRRTAGSAGLCVCEFTIRLPFYFQWNVVWVFMRGGNVELVSALKTH